MRHDNDQEKMHILSDEGSQASDGNFRAMLGHCRQLSFEEEQDAARSGNFDLLIESQLPWVIRIAFNVAKRSQYRDVDSLVSAGNVALVRAVRSFDPDRNLRLTTYVTRPVHWACRSEISRSYFGCAPRIRSKGLSRKTLLWGDCPPKIGKLDEVRDFDTAEVIEKALSSMDPRKVEILRRTAQGAKLRELGVEYGISRERVRQLRDDAAREARTRLEKSFA